MSAGYRIPRGLEYADSWLQKPRVPEAYQLVTETTCAWGISACYRNQVCLRHISWLQSPTWATCISADHRIENTTYATGISADHRIPRGLEIFQLITEYLVCWRNIGCLQRPCVLEAYRLLTEYHVCWRHIGCLQKSCVLEAYQLVTEYLVCKSLFNGSQNNWSIPLI